MELKAKTDLELVRETKLLRDQERESTYRILDYSKEIDRRRLYLDRGYGSLFGFCTGFLGYTEAEASLRISACRLLKEIPILAPKIESGMLSLSVLSKAQSLFNAQEKKNLPLRESEKLEILTRLEGKSTRETEKELVKISPQTLPLKVSKARPLTKYKVELKIILDSKTMAKLIRLQELCSHENLGLPELIDKMADLMLAKKDLTL